MLDQYLSRESRRDQNRSPEDKRIYSRKFDLHQYFSPASRNTKRFIYYDRLKKVSMVHDANTISGDPKTLVVAVRGACPHDGSDLATESSLGIFFGEGSLFNLYDRIGRSIGELHTSNYAELMAVFRALELIKDSSFFDVWRADAENGVYSTAIIMTDSVYVYESLTALIWQLRQNNFRDEMGKPMVNGELIDRIDKTIFDLTERNICVRFWSVPREDNAEAVELANRALIPGP
ncbi:8dbbec6a-51fc-402f-ab38-cf1e699ad2b0-CDS [Sclerotinia trifoliorum]|uniref:8dbbec6a-51fc-402f-ab38-cf1e699ad2b0-CDS n=1 Tax=Sclerotinia trifoliorum TaxID=28548 RepID=A0A8H2VS00_9HELO|nr:8dbbec6a-51fc-402f-ab38-cf1e699ad2b0-CDS [Sclerotinia trifoliorum]